MSHGVYSQRMLKETRKQLGFEEKPYVLVIEDEQFLCELMIKKLENSGFVVRGVFDGEAGLRAVSERRPDLILLDVLLPGIDGFEVLRRLKGGEFKDIPVVVFSNLSEAKDIERAMKNGASFYIIKAQYSPEQIAYKVREFIGKK